MFRMSRTRKDDVPAVKYSIEAHTDAATVYLFDDLGANEEAYLRMALSRLPLAVTRLRIDARKLRSAAPRTLRVLKNVIHYWRRHRGAVIELHAMERFLASIGTLEDRRQCVLQVESTTALAG